MKRLLFLGVFIPAMAFAAPGQEPQRQGGNTADAHTGTAPSPWAQKQIGPAPAGAQHDYAWDEFNHRGRMVWACRDVQDGAIVADELCLSKPKKDTRWPDKNVPPYWKE